MATTSPDSFYVTGGTLRQDAPSYVERQADRDLFEGLQRGEFCYVLTSRQMGKSSLMVHTAARLRQEGVAVAVLDLTAIGQNLSAEQWYGGLLRRLGRQLDPEGDLEETLEEFWFEREARVGPLERWMEALQRIILPQVTGRIVIFIDEIDAVRSLRFSTDEFFAAVRECYNRRTQDPAFERLTFCLLGVATPSDLIQDTRTTPFNIGRRIELTDFTVAEAAPLAGGLSPTPPPPLASLRSCPLQGEGGLSPRPGSEDTAPPSLAGKGVGGLGPAEALLQRILYWTGGHPYLTQRLCQAVAAPGSDEGKVTSEEEERSTRHSLVDRLCEALFLSPSAREKDDNLLFVRERLLKSEADLASLLDLYAKVRRGQRVRVDDTNPLIDLLRLSGVVRLEGGRLVVRNQIYARVFDRNWITTHMPDAERRRQQAAYRRGLVRASAVAGVVLALIGGLAFAATSEAERARHAERVANRKTVDAQQLATRLQDALGEREQALRALQRSLAAERQQRRRADRNEQEARAQARQADQQRQAAVMANGRATHLAEQRQGALVAADAAAHRARTAEASAQEEARRARLSESRAEAAAVRANRLRNAATLNLVKQAWENHNRGLVNQFLAGDLPKAEPGFAWAYWQRLAHLDRMTLRGHIDAVWCAAYSPDGRRIVTGSLDEDRTAKVWDAATGKELLALVGHTAGVCSAAFSPDGRRIVTASYDGTVRVWDAETGQQQLALKGRSDRWTAAAFSPDGRRIVTGRDDCTGRVWDATTGSPLLTLPGKANTLWTVAFSPDGRKIATAGQDTTPRLWDAATGRLLFRLVGHHGVVWKVAFSPDGRRLLSGSGDGTAKVWDVATGKELLSLPVTQYQALAVAFSPDGKQIVTGGWDPTVRLWDALSGQEIGALAGDFPATNAVAFSPDGQQVLTAGTEVNVWDRATFQENSEHPALHLQAHSGAVYSIAFSPDGRRLLTASADGTAKLWDAVTGQAAGILRGTLPQPPSRRYVASAAFSPDGRRLVTGGGDGTTRVWDAGTRAQLLILTGRAGIHAVSFSPDGRRIATAGEEGRAKIWDAATGRLVRTFPGHHGVLQAVAFSPDGRRLVTGSNDGTARVWDVAGSERRVLRGHSAGVTAVAFSPDGRRIVTGSDDHTAKLWDAVTGREQQSLVGHVFAIRSVGFSPDGRQIVTGSDDETVKVWDARVGQELLTLKGGGAPGVSKCSVALSPDGLRLAAGSDDGTVDVWTAALPAQVASWQAAARADEARLAPRRAQLARQRREQSAREAARAALSQDLQLAAQGGDQQVKLEWQAVPHAVGYQLYRSPGNVPDASRLTRLTPQPITGTTFVDRGPGVVNGRPLTYALAPLFRSSAGRVVEGLRTTVRARPVPPPPSAASSPPDPLATSGNQVLVDTDFQQGAAGWVLNGAARLLTLDGRQLLSLTQNQQTQAGTAWYQPSRRLASFRFLADLRIRFDPPSPGDCPADGATLVFARTGADGIGDSGGALGLLAGPIDTFTSFEINTYFGQGLAVDLEAPDCQAGQNETFAFDWVDPALGPARRDEFQGQVGTPEEGGTKIGQTLPPLGMRIVNDGWYRYEWDVDGPAHTMTVYVTGLEASNRQFQHVKLLAVRFPRNPIDFEGRFGLTAGTGARVEHVEVAAVRIEAPPSAEGEVR